jgi:hypothetical protein
VREALVVKAAPMGALLGALTYLLDFPNCVSAAQAPVESRTSVLGVQRRKSRQQILVF